MFVWVSASFLLRYSIGERRTIRPGFRPVFCVSPRGYGESREVSRWVVSRVEMRLESLTPGPMVCTPPSPVLGYLPEFWAL